MALQWMPRGQWDALVRGEGCEMCANMQDKVNEHGFRVADLGVSVLWLQRNQGATGYCVLICKQHVSEPYHLTPPEQVVVFQDLMRAGTALEQVYTPDKMNFQILGNSLPHLHCHIMPRYYGDPAPGMPFNVLIEHARVLESEDAYLEQVQKIRLALGLSE
jgi:diadenosine tetraphosphate (Ap4A) HIT family hydrolase